jgi:hypothetical protein
LADLGFEIANCDLKALASSKRSSENLSEILKRVTPQAALRELDKFIGALPRAQTEDDLAFESSVLDWVRRAAPDDQNALFVGLRTWLTGGEATHRFVLVALIGAAFSDRALIDLAVATAVHPPPQWEAQKRSILGLALVDLAVRFPDAGLTAYLELVASGVPASNTYQDQNLAARAAIALCFLRQRGAYDACIAPVLAGLRDRTPSPLEEARAFASLLGRRAH